MPILVNKLKHNKHDQETTLTYMYWMKLKNTYEFGRIYALLLFATGQLVCLKFVTKVEPLNFVLAPYFLTLRSPVGPEQKK